MCAVFPTVFAAPSSLARRSRPALCFALSPHLLPQSFRNVPAFYWFVFHPFGRDGDALDAYHGELWQYRWRLIATILKHGIDVVHFDVDAVVLKPLDAVIDASAADLISGRGGPGSHMLLSAGALFLRSSAETLAVVPLVMKDIAAARAAGKGHAPDDTRILNAVVARAVNGGTGVRWKHPPLAKASLVRMVEGSGAIDSSGPEPGTLRLLLLSNVMVRRLHCETEGYVERGCGCCSCSHTTLLSPTHPRLASPRLASPRLASGTWPRRRTSCTVPAETRRGTTRPWPSSAPSRPAACGSCATTGRRRRAACPQGRPWSGGSTRSPPPAATWYRSFPPRAATSGPAASASCRRAAARRRSSARRA